VDNYIYSALLNVAVDLAVGLQYSKNLQHNAAFQYYSKIP